MSRPIDSATYLANGPLSHSLDSLSSEWAWPIRSTSCRVNVPRRANGSEHMYDNKTQPRTHSSRKGTCNHAILNPSFKNLDFHAGLGGPRRRPIYIPWKLEMGKRKTFILLPTLHIYQFGLLNNGFMIFPYFNLKYLSPD